MSALSDLIKSGNSESDLNTMIVTFAANGQGEYAERAAVELAELRADLAAALDREDVPAFAPGTLCACECHKRQTVTPLAVTLIDDEPSCQMCADLTGDTP